MRFLASVISAVAISSATAFVPSSPISAPPRLSALHLSSSSSTATEVTGTVKWYNAERGFGFIEVDDGGPDMYVHATGLTFDGPLIDGDRVSFATEMDKRTKKPKAVNVVRAAGGDEAAPAVEEEPTLESVVEKVIEVVKDDLDDDVKAQRAAAAEKFQRSRLAAQLEQRAKEASAAVLKAAQDAEKFHRAMLASQLEQSAKDAVAKAARLAKEAEEKRIAEEKAAAEAAAKAAAEAAAAEEARLAKEAEEKRLAEEKAAAEAAAKAAAEAAAAEEARLAKEAEEKRLAAEAAARELGYPSVAVMMARQQPKSPEEEASLAAKYGAMELGERAFTILADLGMIDLNPDPDDPNRDTSKDDEDIE